MLDNHLSRVTFRLTVWGSFLQLLAANIQFSFTLLVFVLQSVISCFFFPGATSGKTYISHQLHERPSVSRPGRWKLVMTELRFGYNIEWQLELGQVLDRREQSLYGPLITQGHLLLSSLETPPLALYWCFDPVSVRAHDQRQNKTTHPHSHLPPTVAGS